VLVDIGTGFYVEKTPGEAKTFYDGKVKELAANLGDLEKIVKGKQGGLGVVEDGEFVCWFFWMGGGGVFGGGNGMADAMCVHSFTAEGYCGKWEGGRGGDVRLRGGLIEWGWRT